jgi:hypothetical protein
VRRHGGQYHHGPDRARQERLPDFGGNEEIAAREGEKAERGT